MLTTPGTRSRLYNSSGFFFLAWATHYFPFQTEPSENEVAYQAAKSGKKNSGLGAVPKKHLSARERFGSQSMLPSWIAAGVILSVVAAGWYFFLPLTYGYPGLSVDQVLRRKWLGYDLHFAK
jgi:dolichyl-phosphate-mannose-protein mannosyltransferase